MRILQNNIIVRVFMLALPLFLFSCEEAPLPTGAETTDQLFRPVNFQANVIGTEVTFKWSDISDASFILEISKDSLMFSNELQVISLDKNYYTTTENENLWSNTRYSARIKAVSSVDGAIKDSEYQEVTFVTGSEETFYSVESDNIGFDWVQLNWIPGKNVDKIIVSSAGVSDVTISLTADEIAAGEKLIENLNLGTDYTFTIYFGERPRGAISVATWTYFSTVKIDQTSNGGWHELGTYYLFANSGAYARIRNDGTSGYVVADAFKFSRDGYDDIIIDNTDDGVTTVGTWSTSSTSADRIGANYFHDGKSGKGEKSITYTPDIPESGAWTVSVYSSAQSISSNNVPIDIYAGDH